MKFSITLLLIAVLSVRMADAKNVDLSTVPVRDGVQLTIYNSEDITLVRERRTVTFKKGVNPLQFSWANTLIDPTSVELKFLTQADKLDVLDTTFPHDKPQMLYWNVNSDFDGAAQIEITYFTSGITWSADYVGIANRDETHMALENFVRVQNNSGERYDGAQIRLVVGTINLVEKIAQLAQISTRDVDKLEDSKRKELRQNAAKDFFARGAGAAESAAGGSGMEEKQIVKEGLSEYFIYTVEGTETIETGWSKRMRSFEAREVPFKIQYRYRPSEYGDQLVRMYLLTNDKASTLGTTPLPDGIVRLFRDNGRDGLSYLTQQQIKYIPIADKIELNLGVDPEVIFELLKLKAFRDNIWMHVHGPNVFRRVEDGAVKIDVDSSVAGWDDHAMYVQRVRNYTSKTIDLEIRRAYPGHILFRSQLQPAAKLHDFQTVELHTQVEPGKKTDLPYEVVQHQGRNATQNNVTLESSAQ